MIVLRDLHLLFDPTHRYYQYPAKRVLSKVQSVVDMVIPIAEDLRFYTSTHSTFKFRNIN